MANQTDSTINNGLDFDRLGGTNPEPSTAPAGMTTLEKAAKSMHDSQEAFYAVATLWRDENDYVKAQWAKLARAAIEALKESTPDMRIAGGIALASAMQTAETLVDPVDASWKAMLNAILSEKPDA